MGVVRWRSAQATGRWWKRRSQTEYGGRQEETNMRDLIKTGLTELTEAELELVSGGQINAPPPTSNGATLIGGPPPTLILTPHGVAVEPGTGRIILRP